MKSSVILFVMAYTKFWHIPAHDPDPLLNTEVHRVFAQEKVHYTFAGLDRVTQEETDRDRFAAIELPNRNTDCRSPTAGIAKAQQHAQLTS